MGFYEMYFDRIYKSVNLEIIPNLLRIPFITSLFERKGNIHHLMDRLHR